MGGESKTGGAAGRKAAGSRWGGEARFWERVSTLYAVMEEVLDRPINTADMLAFFGETGMESGAESNANSWLEQINDRSV